MRRLGPLFYFRKSGAAGGQFFIRRNVVVHLSVVEFLVSHHIEITGSGKSEYDGLLFARLFAADRLVDGDADGVGALRRGQDSDRKSVV